MYFNVNVSTFRFGDSWARFALKHKDRVATGSHCCVCLNLEDLEDEFAVIQLRPSTEYARCGQGLPYHSKGDAILPGIEPFTLS